jgi:hypothetical protein
VVFLAAMLAAVLTGAPGDLIRVEVDGPMARVDVHRTFAAASLSRPWELTLDLALPEGARVTTATVALARPPGNARGGKTARLVAGPSLPESAAPWRAPYDPAATHRFVAAPVGAGDAVVLDLAFVAPLACVEGQWALVFPGAVDANVAEAEVRVRLRDRAAVIELPEAALPTSRPSKTAQGRAPARASWRVAMARGADAVAEVFAAPGQPGPPGTTSSKAWWLSACRPLGVASLPPPGGLAVAVDVSLSVGLAGLSAERLALRTLIEALPGATWLAPVTFARTARPLFAAPRMATREALQAIDGALSPERLENGTDTRALLAALEGARASLDLAVGAEGPDGNEVAAPAGAPDAWQVILTDGALSDDGLAVMEVPRQGAGLPAAPAPTAVVIVRPDAEESPSPGALDAWARLPSAAGGVLRATTSSRAPAEIAKLVTDMRRGGDVFGLDVVFAGGAPRLRVARALAPGDGLTFILQDGGRAPPAWLEGRHQGRPFKVAIRRAASALAPANAHAWEATAGGVRFVLRPAPAAEPDGPPVPPRGRLERSVVRNALSMAFVPRARACYLRRTARDKSARDLHGRVRLALTLERGEMTGAAILESTLAHAEVERCLVEAAFAVRVPRPAGRDDPSVAILNLVFRPHPPRAARRGDDGDPDRDPDLDRRLDILLGPVTRAGEAGADVLEVLTP